MPCNPIWLLAFRLFTLDDGHLKCSPRGSASFHLLQPLKKSYPKVWYPSRMSGYSLFSLACSVVFHTLSPDSP